MVATVARPGSSPRDPPRLRGSQEAMRDVASVNVKSRGYPSGVDTGCRGALEKGGTSVRRIEQRDRPVACAQETMIHCPEVVVVSGDLPRKVNGNRKRPRTAWRRRRRDCIKRTEGAVVGTHKPTKIAPKGISRNRLKVVSRDFPQRIDGNHILLDGNGEEGEANGKQTSESARISRRGQCTVNAGTVSQKGEGSVVCVGVAPYDRSQCIERDGEGALKETCCARIGVIESSDRTVLNSHEAVKYQIRVEERTNDDAFRADARGHCPERFSARHIELCDRPVGGPYEAVRDKFRVEEVARDRACGVDGDREGALRIRDIEGADRSVSDPDKAVRHEVRVQEVPGGHTCRVNGERERTLAGACACTLDIAMV
jgi:hypothetical protein